MYHVYANVSGAPERHIWSSKWHHIALKYAEIASRYFDSVRIEKA